MKSLEIVNEKIRKHEARIIEIQPIWEYVKDLHIIKQDLEVLKIIKNRIKCIDNKGSHGFKNSHKHFSFILYNHLEEQKEDFNIVKQWMEEND